MEFALVCAALAVALAGTAYAIHQSRRHAALPNTFPTRNVLDSLSTHVAIASANGAVEYVNRAWRQFGQDRGKHTLARMAVGEQVADFLSGWKPGDEGAAGRIQEGLAAIHAGKNNFFETDYRDSLDGDDLFFMVRITPLAGSRTAVITHSDVTLRRKQGEADATEKFGIELEEANSREMASLDRLAGDVVTPVTSQAYGLTDLRTSVPADRDRLLSAYESCLEYVLARRAYKDPDPPPVSLQEIASELGYLRARPRDVIDMHREALRRATRRAAPGRAQAYVEEGRLLILELMGHLAAYYRTGFDPRTASRKTIVRGSELNGE